MRDGGGGERGSASVVVLALAGVLVAATLVMLAAGQVVRGRHRAASAADLAALAAAGALVQGRTDPCRLASSVASANQGRLRSCRVVGRDVVVRVDAPTRLALWFRLPLLLPSAWARAGPQR